MLSPKRVKHRKEQRRISRRLLGSATRGITIAFGEFGLVALDHKFITSRQIEAARIALTRFIKRGGKVWIRIFPSFPYTKKPAETRMGSGKGSLDAWVAPVKPGQVIFEVGGVSADLAKGAIQRAIAKLPTRAKFVSRGSIT